MKEILTDLTAECKESDRQSGLGVQHHLRCLLYVLVREVIERSGVLGGKYFRGSGLVVYLGLRVDVQNIFG